jgi:hypothetical protein
MLGLGAAAITLYLVLAFRFGHPDNVFRVLTFVNYLGMRFGPTLVGQFFDPRRFVPLRSEAVVFDIFLVFSSGLQWFVFGAVIDFLRKKS